MRYATNSTGGDLETVDPSWYGWDLSIGRIPPESVGGLYSLRVDALANSSGPTAGSPACSAATSPQSTFDGFFDIARVAPAP